jgi:hypothetical protein
MAVFSATLTGVNNGARSGGTMPLPRSIEDSTATIITTSGTSQQASITAATTDRKQVWVLTASGADVWVKFGTNPTAVASSGFYIVSGQTREFSVTEASEKVAVINA